MSHFATSRLPVQPTARPPSGQGRDRDAASHTTGQEGSPHLFSGFSLEPKRPGNQRAAADWQPLLTLKEDRGVARASRVLGRIWGLTHASKSQAGSLGRAGQPLQRTPSSSAERARWQTALRPRCFLRLSPHPAPEVWRLVYYQQGKLNTWPMDRSASRRWRRDGRKNFFASLPPSPRQDSTPRMSFLLIVTSSLNDHM